jgi:hypothetical protein
MGMYAATLAHLQVQQNLAGNREPHHQLCLSIDVQCREVHIAPRTSVQRAQNLENACRFIAALWETARASYFPSRVSELGQHLASLLNGAPDCLRYNDHQIGHGPA